MCQNPACMSYPEFGICVGSLLLCAAGFAFLGDGGWPGALHECVATSTCYCESKQAGWIAQPANTWSGLAFIAVGLAVAWHAGWARTTERPIPDNPIASSHLYPGLLALSICLLGPGAMLFHASLTDWGGILDIASMYLFLNFWLLYNLKRLYGWSDATFLLAYVVATVAFTSPRLLSPAYGVPVSSSSQRSLSRQSGSLHGPCGGGRRALHLGSNGIGTGSGLRSEHSRSRAPPRSSFRATPRR